MNEELLEYIKNLSLKDNKTLSQKALKTAEEVGELAKAILPFENAPGTNHRFMSKENVLEECADVILCALSVAYSLKCTDTDLEEILINKAGKWATLQAQESRCEKNSEFKLPFELHITVKITNSTQQTKFVNFCNEIGLKPIILENIGVDFVMLDVMTETKLFGNNRYAYETLKEISKGIQNAGFEVVREKIETVPWHPASPHENGSVEKMPENGYFEAHLSYDIPIEKFDSALRRFQDNEELKVSKSLTKSTDSMVRVFVTIRTYKDMYEEFVKNVERCKVYIGRWIGMEPIAELHEFSIYDTDVSHDAKWIGEE